MSINLYKGNGAQSNRSNRCLLRAVMNTEETATEIKIIINYTVEKEVTNNWDDPRPTRYGILVYNASVNGDGEFSNKGQILQTKSISSFVDKSEAFTQEGTVTFSIEKTSKVQNYNGVTFLISDQPAIERDYDDTYLWTGQKGGSVNTARDSFSVTTLTIPVAYTPCVAPTLETEKNYPALGSVITLEWEGAQAGTSNPITGYKLRWKTTTDSEYSYSNTINNTESSGSTNWSVSSIDNSWEPGTKIEISIMTIGTVSGYDSEYSDPIEIIINTAPMWEADPVLNQTSFYKGFSGSIEASLRAKDGDEGDSVVYYYSTSNNFSNASVISDNTITISGDDSSLIYFWASDGKNESEVKTVGLSYYSIDPGSFKVSSNDTYIAGENNYSKSFTLTAGKPENISKYRFYYGRGIVPDQLLAEQQSEIYNISNIYELRPDNYPLPNTPWSFGVKFVYNIDGNETVSEMVEEVMTALPPVGEVVREEEVSYFSNKIICELPDTGINRLDIQTSPQSATTVSYEIDTTNNQIILDTSKLTNGVSYTFSILPYRNSQSGTTSTFSATKIYSLSFQNISFSAPMAFPHDYSEGDSTETFNLSFTYPFNNTSFENLIPADYGLTSVEDIKILVGYGNKTYNLSDNITLDNWRIDNSYNGQLVKSIPFDFFNTMVRDKQENLGIVDYTGQYPLTFSLTANGVTTSASTNFILNFDKAPEITGISITGFLEDKDNNIYLIQQGDILRYTITFKHYNSYAINTDINILRAKDEIDRKWSPYTSSQTDNWFSAQKLGAPESSTFYFEKEVGPITDSNYIGFSATLSSVGSSRGAGNTLEWNPDSLPVVSVKHVSPGLTISGGYYSDGEVGFNYNFSQDDKGIYVLERQNNYSLSSILELSTEPSFPTLIPEPPDLSLTYNSSSIGTQKIEYDNFPEDSTFIYARVKTTTGGGDIKPRFFYSNVLTIFKETPTISYRKNYLGINYKLPTSIEDNSPYKDAILVIGETSGRNKIHYVGASGLGQICGFIIKGGTWDPETNE